MATMTTEYNNHFYNKSIDYYTRSVKFEVEDSGDDSNFSSIKNHYARAQVYTYAYQEGNDVYVVAKVTMVETKTGTSGIYPAVSLRVAINGTEKVNKYYDYAKDDDSRWKTFPTYGNNTNQSYYQKIKSGLTGSLAIPVTVSICAGQSAVDSNLAERYKSKTVYVDYKNITLPSRPTISSITGGTKGESFRIVGTNSTNSTNMTLGGSALFYTTAINGNTPSDPSFNAYGDPLKGTTRADSNTSKSGGAIDVSVSLNLGKDYKVKAVCRNAFYVTRPSNTDKRDWYEIYSEPVTSNTVDYWTDAGNPTISISPGAQGKSFTISGKHGTVGTDNSLLVACVFYTTDGTTPSYNTSTWEPSNTATKKATLSATTANTIYTATVSGLTADSTINATVINKFTKQTKKVNATKVTMTYQADGGVPSIYIDDPENNTVKIHGYQGKQGNTSNPIQSTVVYYRWNSGNWISSNDNANTGITANSGAEYTFNLYVPEDYRPGGNTIEAYVTTTYAIGSKSMYSKDKPLKVSDIRYYINPTAPGEPRLTDDSYKSGRLTLKKLWTWTWEPSISGNNYSQVDSYRIRLYQNGYRIPVKGDPSGNGQNGTNNYAAPANRDNLDYFYDTHTTSNSITIDPVLHKFSVGDTVKLGIYAHASKKNDYDMWNDGGKAAYEVFQGGSADFPGVPVQNTGIVVVKANDTWKEGQVYTKVDGEWKEAECVYVKVDGEWKEST